MKLSFKHSPYRLSQISLRTAQEPPKTSALSLVFIFIISKSLVVVMPLFHASIELDTVSLLFIPH